MNDWMWRNIQERKVNISSHKRKAAPKLLRSPRCGRNRWPLSTRSQRCAELFSRFHVVTLQARSVWEVKGCHESKEIFTVSFERLFGKNDSNCVTSVRSSLEKFWQRKCWFQWFQHLHFSIDGFFPRRPAGPGSRSRERTPSPQCWARLAHGVFRSPFLAYTDMVTAYLLNLLYVLVVRGWLFPVILLTHCLWLFICSLLDGDSEVPEAWPCEWWHWRQGVSSFHVQLVASCLRLRRWQVRPLRFASVVALVLRSQMQWWNRGFAAIDLCQSNLKFDNSIILTWTFWLEIPGGWGNGAAAPLRAKPQSTRYGGDIGRIFIGILKGFGIHHCRGGTAVAPPPEAAPVFLPHWEMELQMDLECFIHENSILPGSSWYSSVATLRKQLLKINSGNFVKQQPSSNFS